MSKTEREFQIFAKPVGAVCNLNCTYCYYLIKKEIYPADSSFLMPDDLLEKYVIQHIEATTDDIITFSWHGGEPLMAGIDFYRKAVALQQKYKPEGKILSNGLQTNGTLLNDEWCRFLSENGFTVGVSIDGPAEFHNLNRLARNGRNTSDEVITGFNLLKKYGITPEVLCVVNSANVRFPLEVYNYLKQLGPEYLAFLPLVEKDPDSPSGASENSVPAKEFGIFLGRVFDEWVEKDIGEIKIQVFEEAIRPAFGQDHTLCIFKTDCGGVPVVEHNGDFYSCDHYVNNEHLLGNINDKSLTYFLDSEKQQAFGKAKSLTLPAYCKNCEVLAMCNGECPKNRFIFSPDGEPGLNYLCEGYKYFFNHCRPFVEAISFAWKNQGI
jgi:uncharacterized protein